MRVKFHDNISTVIHFNPEIMVYADGTIIILPKDGLPMYAGQVKSIWVDLKGLRYSNDSAGLTPGSFKAIWTEENTIHIVRYKDSIAKEPFLKRLKNYAGIS